MYDVIANSPSTNRPSVYRLRHLRHHRMLPSGHQSVPHVSEPDRQHCQATAQPHFTLEAAILPSTKFPYVLSSYYVPSIGGSVCHVCYRHYPDTTEDMSKYHERRDGTDLTDLTRTKGMEGFVLWWQCTKSCTGITPHRLNIVLQS